MNAFTASLARRSALVSAAFAATLTGHLMSGEGLRVLPVAPVLWCGLLGVFIMLSGRRTKPTFAAWSPAATLRVLLLTQAAMHLLLHQVPWAFGLLAHPGHELITASAVAAHAVVALALLVPLCWGQRILERAVAVVHALAGGATDVAGTPRHAHILGLEVRRPALARRASTLSARGPPTGESPRAPGNGLPALA